MGLVEDVAAAVEACDEGRVVALLLSVDEPARRAVVPVAQRLRKASDKVVQVGSGFRMDERHAAACLAVFGSGTPAQVVAAGWLFDDEEHRQLARSRPRAWQQELAERAPVDAWPLVRGLVRDGLIDEPMTDAHVLGLIRYEPWRGEGRPGTVLDRLRDDPGLLSTTVWRLFEVEGGGEDSLAAHDKYAAVSRSWTQALTTLAGTGELDRQRLLDASLAALRRDWSPFRAQWMTAFHTALTPTLEERAARADAYAALLRAQAPAVVGFAVTALAQLQQAGRLDAEVLIRSASPAVRAPGKGTATAAVRLVARSAAASPVLAAQVLGEAAGSEHAQVRAAAAKALSVLTGRPAPAPRAPVVAVAPRPRPQPVIGDLTSRRVLVPVADLEDLRARLAVVLERADDPDEVELVLDGLSRLCSEPDAEQALAVVARRAAVVARRETDDVAAVVAAVVGAWADRTPHDLTAGWVRSDYRGAARWQLLRLNDLIERLVARVASRLVACPTHEGGWLDPDVLLERLVSTPAPAALELAVALLRLPGPPSDERLDRAVARVSGVRRRQPAGPAVEAAAALEPVFRFDVAPDRQGRPVLTVHPQSPVPLGLDGPVPLFDDGGWARWYATLWPRAVRVRDATAARLVAEDLDWWGSRWGAVPCSSRCSTQLARCCPRGACCSRSACCASSPRSASSPSTR